MNALIPHKIIKPATFIASFNTIKNAVVYYNRIGLSVEYIIKAVIKELNETYKKERLFNNKLKKFARQKLDRISIRIDENNKVYISYNIYKKDYMMRDKLVPPNCPESASFLVEGRREGLILNSFIEIVNYYKELIIYLGDYDVCKFSSEVEISLYFTGSKKSITELSIINNKTKKLFPQLLLDIYKIKLGLNKKNG